MSVTQNVRFPQQNLRFPSNFKWGLLDSWFSVYNLNKPECFSERLGNYWTLYFDLGLRTWTSWRFWSRQFTWPLLTLTFSLFSLLSLSLCSLLFTHFGVTHKADFLLALIFWPNVEGICNKLDLFWYESRFLSVFFCFLRSAFGRRSLNQP